MQPKAIRSPVSCGIGLTISPDFNCYEHKLFKTNTYSHIEFCVSKITAGFFQNSMALKVRRICLVWSSPFRL